MKQEQDEQAYMHHHTGTGPFNSELSGQLAPYNWVGPADFLAREPH